MHDYSHTLAHFARLRRWRGGWVARCPAHEDDNPSLLLWVSPRGHLRAKCMAGCVWRDIVRESGTDAAGWLPPKEERPRRRMEDKKIAAIYDYRDAQGRLLYQVVRFEPKDFRCRHAVNGKWAWNMDGVERVPYRLPELLADKRQPVIVVEGEKDADNLRSLGLVGTTNNGGAGKWPHEFGKYLAGRRVAVIPDADAPGRAHAAAVAGSLLMWGVESLRIVTLADRGKDVSDWLQNAIPTMSLEKKRDALIRLIKTAPEWAVMNRAA